MPILSDISFFESPIGRLRISASHGAVTGIALCGDTEKPIHTADTEILTVCIRQLDEYFRKERTSFSFPIKPEGTDFQKRVWAELLKIPYGKTCSYAEIAAGIGCEKGYRAVGNAVRCNPVPIAVPCHRVVRKTGSTGGFAWGSERKKYLLYLERRS